MFSDFTKQLSKLHLATSRLARKTNNFHLAEQLLMEEAGAAIRGQPENGKIGPADSLMVALAGVRISNGTVDQLKLLKMERETAKLLQCKGQNREAIETMSTSIVAHAKLNAQTISAIQNRELHATCTELNSRSLVTLVQWLQADYKNLGVLTSQLKVIGQGDDTNATYLVRNLKLLVDLEQTKPSLSDDVEKAEEGTLCI